MRNLRWALAFLTRIPLTPSDPAGFPAPAIGVWFPVAGLVIGGVVGGIFWAASQLLPAMPAAVLAIASGALLTGGFHEDGLADTFDAVGGGNDVEAVLRIFKDSRLGTFGVAALILSILFKVTLLGTLDATAGLLALMAAHSIGRGVAAATMGWATPATAGLGTSLMAGFTRAHAVAAAAVGLAIGAFFVGLPAVFAFTLAAIAATTLVRWATGKAGGITGDVLGAIEQFGEMAVLAAVVASVDQWSIPWWS